MIRMVNIKDMQMSDQIIEVLNYLGEKLGISIDWTSENVVPYAQELCGKYITYEIVTSIMWLVIALSLFGSIVISFKKIYDIDDDLFTTFILPFIIVMVIAIIIIISQSIDIIRCITIPELEIYNKIKELLN